MAQMALSTNNYYPIARRSHTHVDAFDNQPT